MTAEERNSAQGNEELSDSKLIKLRNFYKMKESTREVMDDETFYS